MAVVPIPLRDICSRVYIVAHKENTDRLHDFLDAEGFVVEVVRGPYTPEQTAMGRNVRVLVNHSNVWRKVASGTGVALVLEADFVPVRNFGQLKLPFPYSAGEDSAKFGWLYSGGSILYGFDPQGYPHGHGNTTVAYALTPGAARHLLDFASREIGAAGPGEYRAWETYMGIFLRKQVGVLNYIPVYQYGEHGGIENPEHRSTGIRGWHQADILWGPLAFEPGYAKGSLVRYRAIRARGWLRALYRLVTRRFFDPRYINSDSSQSRVFMATWSILRMFHLAK